MEIWNYVLYIIDKRLQQSHRCDNQNEYRIKISVWIATDRTARRWKTGSAKGCLATGIVTKETYLGAAVGYSSYRVNMSRHTGEKFSVENTSSEVVWDWNSNTKQTPKSTAVREISPFWREDNSWLLFCCGGDNSTAGWKMWAGKLLPGLISPEAPDPGWNVKGSSACGNFSIFSLLPASVLGSE